MQASLLCLSQLWPMAPLPVTCLQKLLLSLVQSIAAGVCLLWEPLQEVSRGFGEITWARQLSPKGASDKAWPGGRGKHTVLAGEALPAPCPQCSSYLAALPWRPGKPSMWDLIPGLHLCFGLPSGPTAESAVTGDSVALPSQKATMEGTALWPSSLSGEHVP